MKKGIKMWLLVILCLVVGCQSVAKKEVKEHPITSEFDNFYKKSLAELGETLPKQVQFTLDSFMSNLNLFANPFVDKISGYGGDKNKVLDLLVEKIAKSTYFKYSNLDAKDYSITFKSTSYLRDSNYLTIKELIREFLFWWSEKQLPIAMSTYSFESYTIKDNLIYIKDMKFVENKLQFSSLYDIAYDFTTLSDMRLAVGRMPWINESLRGSFDEARDRLDTLVFSYRRPSYFIDYFNDHFKDHSMYLYTRPNISDHYHRADLLETELNKYFKNKKFDIILKEEIVDNMPKYTLTSMKEEDIADLIYDYNFRYFFDLYDIKAKDFITR